MRIYDVRAVRVGDGVSVTWRDVSERHAAAADLAASEALYRSIFDASHDGIVLQQRDGRVLAWNAAAARILGVEPEEFIAAHSGALEWGGVREDGSPLPASEHPSRRTLATGDSCVEVVVGFRRGDEMRWVDVTTTPLFAEDEELPTAVVAVMADVTEQHRTRDELELRGAQLEATNKELEAFVYSVSHDLRQPLSAINAFSQLVVEDAGDRLGEDEREFLRRVRAATQRMAAMLDGLLKLSRASRLDLVSERVDVSTMTREILAELRAEQPERRVDCVVAPGLHVQADPALMRVVLVNLLDNALKFTSRHETARVEVGRTVFDGELAFFVRDDGDGFDPAGAGELFQPFHRLHRADEFPGTGIGLATVQRLVARYGGRIWAEGAVAKGATFYFTLPGPASTS